MEHQHLEHIDGLPRDLGGGLLLRRATPEDADRLAQFNSIIHSDEGPDHPDTRVGAWTRDLMSGRHPTFSPGDCTIVEDTLSGQIVSSMNLISQQWDYAGIPFKVGRPELVGTLPEYRRRGLVRAQFDTVHRWSLARGEMVQAITGIPNYYRQFGYEMGLDLGGGRTGYQPHVPQLGEGQSEPYLLRPAQEGDVPFLKAIYDHGRKRWLVGCDWSEALWRFNIAGAHPDNVNRLAVAVIESTSGEKVGFVGYPPYTWGPVQAATLFELQPGASWWMVTPSVIRFLWKTGEIHAARDRGEMGAFCFALGRSHPVYQSAPDRLPRVRQPYAWYLRVPDLGGFLRQIAPVLEARLEGSVCVGFTGDLKLHFYRAGVKLEFVNGRLTAVTNWQETSADHAAAAFPDYTFLQLLFGYRTLDELRFAFADARVNDEKYVPLLEALFPCRPSDVWGAY